MDVHAGRKVVVIGRAIAQRLYPFVDPIGRDIRVDGRKYKIIGVFDEKKSAFGSQYERYVLTPVSTFLNTYGNVDRSHWLIVLHSRRRDLWHVAGNQGITSESD
jgi:putative ABC transport system permease protein